MVDYSVAYSPSCLLSDGVSILYHIFCLLTSCCDRLSLSLPLSPSVYLPSLSTKKTKYNQPTNHLPPPSLSTQALEWEESQRKVMYNPATADYFLQYTDGNGNKNGTIYQEDIEFGDQFFWDFTNSKAGENAQQSTPTPSRNMPEDTDGCPPP